MYKWKVSEELQDKLKKLSRKDKALHEQVIKKIDEIINSSDVEHYKSLRHNMKDSKRVHIGHFVLIFQYIKENDTINFDDFDHHYKIYTK